MPDEPEASSGSGTDSLDGATGVFWFDGGPQKRGTLHLAKNGLKVITEGIARQPQSYSFSIGDGAASWALTHSGRPEDAVADNTAVPLLATLDDGRKIAVRDARLAAEPPIGTQDILGTKILLGAHAPTRATTFAAARVALPKAVVGRGIFRGSAPLEVPGHVFIATICRWCGTATAANTTPTWSSSNPTERTGSSKRR